MATTTIYASAQGGSDASSGSSASPVATIAKSRELADAVIAGDPEASVVVVLRAGYYSIPSGGDQASVLFQTSQTYGDLEIQFEAGAWQIYGTHFVPSSDGYQTHTLALPTDCTIEAVQVDHEMADPTHVTSDGRRKMWLKAAADAAACQSTSGTFFHTGSTLHVNLPTASGVIIVRYRPVTDVLMNRLSGQNLRMIGAGKTVCGILWPLYKSSGVACYGIQMLGTPTTHTRYVVRGLRLDGSWHAIGVLSTPTNGSLFFDDIPVSDCEFNAEVIGDHSGILSYNPVVIYSGNTTGTVGTPVYLDITGWTTDDCVFNLHRPVYYDGTSFGNTTDVFGNAIAGGAIGNNQAHLLYSHGGDAYCLPRVYGCRMRNCTVNMWDYQCIGPFFGQRNYQSHTDTPHSDAAWESWMEDCTIAMRMAYSSGDAGLNYGAVSFSYDINVRMKRVTWLFPDRMSFASAAGTALFTLGSSGSPVYMELEECKVVIGTNAAAVAGNWCRAFRLGSTSAGTVVFRARNCTFVHNQASMPADIVWFDGDGASAAITLELRDCIFHAADNTHHVLIYDISTAQLPLYSTNPARLVCENNLYSGITASKFDISGGGARDTEAEWKANSGDGPHDGTLGNGAGRDARYASAGTFNLTTLAFGASDLARTAKIDSSVSLNYAPTSGLNGRPFDRRFGADQFGAGSIGALIGAGILD